ncbi:hypothetical protein A2526_01725 [candidate division WOR-1 bacterium RIFOXYD2_FULL_36_8]|uniref:Peptidase C39-like domain-containing protein n=1 Tax=candidate division WOR-1 bacterium RIFOXYB2_FULL_36_35 TaxID=1802578 RepID=A0A1F4S3Z5_UNCSA|nr:MAG: hypothetical protein A2230_02910 [candidate division WOR-1 bacterium RIFOXYA2_FULL_36_21]OGC15144.1 MAG: hypothetical protein A2282_09030 [candidate division WOR-1 bacterium RIFOXYA12_FULL_36_13]OGC15156.1 MAG: hypothetical protein A2290_08820 [candidate division WOR-1 bacterium RIFOXYB2_FULL_36_35]OGC41829.1 MAG: hypothetical protein A2526_01725 [candidate division WOR-1 bacterium RIFOXYD2_FULL_36_8]
MFDKFGFFSPDAVSLATSKKTPQKNSDSKLSFIDSLKNIAASKQKSVDHPSFYSDQKDVKLEVPNLLQGHNQCGPTSLAMILNYYGKDVSNYKNMFIGEDTVGHGPYALRNRALERGMKVYGHNNASIEDLVKMVDIGIPPLVLGIYGGKQVEGGPSLDNFIKNCNNAHWMVVTGYKKDENGKVTHIYFNNPNKSEPQCWEAQKFIDEFWDKNIIPGGQRFYMAFAPKNDFRSSVLDKSFPRGDKYSSAFDRILKAINKMEKTFYAAETVYDKVFDEETQEKIEETVKNTIDKAKQAKEKVQEKTAKVKDKIKNLFS